MTTPKWPPGAPPLADLVREYASLIHRTARRRGVRAADVPDCAQGVILRFHRAIVAGRLDASRPAGLGGWLIKTTSSVARDFLRLRRHRHEALMSPETIEREETRDQEERMSEAVDVHNAVDQILPKMTPEQREVFVMVDLEDTPMEEALKELPFGRTVAYEHLNAARATFRREWTAMQKAGTVAASIAALTVEELIAAEHVIADVPPSYIDDILRRLGEQLGEDFLAGPASDTAVAAGAKLGTGATRAATWKVAVGVLVAGAAGATLLAALRSPGAGPSPAPTAAVLQAPPGSAPAMATPTSPAVDSVDAPRQGSGTAHALPLPPPTAVQTTLVDNARSLLDKHQPAKALPLLARVTAPELADERDQLRALAFRQQAAAQAVDAGAMPR
jgi:RNA polymerase sigma factor (sigma-70 family)